MLDNDGSVNLIEALKAMPENVGYTMAANNIPSMTHLAGDWTEEKK